MLRHPRILALAGLLCVTFWAGAQSAEPVGDLTLVATTTSTSYTGTPQISRSLGAAYACSKRAPAGASASLDVPAGLGVGTSVPVQIHNPEGADTVSTHVELIRYWGCSATVPRGQPEVTDASHQATGKTYREGSSGNADPMKLSNLTGHTPGKYVLHTSYAGETRIELGASQDFLDPVQFTAPGQGMVKADLSQPIALSWSKVPRAAGYSLNAAGTNAAGKTVMWEAIKDGNWAFYELGMVRSVEKGRMLGPDHLSCTIPAGIFAGSCSVTLAAYSPESRGGGSMRALGWAQTTTMLMLMP